MQSDSFDVECEILRDNMTCVHDEGYLTRGYMRSWQNIAVKKNNTYITKINEDKSETTISECGEGFSYCSYSDGGIAIFYSDKTLILDFLSMKIYETTLFSN